MHKAFTLLELVIVVVILGVLFAVAVPQLGLASQDSPGKQLRADLRVMRNAIELFYRDHGVLPGVHADGTREGVAGSASAFVSQLTHRTDHDGNVVDSADAAGGFGPYLAAIPPCPVGPHLGSRKVVTIGSGDLDLADAGEAGWIYNARTGYIWANSKLVDAEGLRYERY